MKTTILFFAAAGLLLSACQNDQKDFYTGAPAAYFSDFTAPADSLVYSFLGKPAQEAAVTLNVRLLGNELDAPRQLRLRVVPEKTTAQAGKHYQALPETFDLTPGAYNFELPVTLYKHSDLDQHSLTLTVEIVDDARMRLAFRDNARVRIVFSNIIMKPQIWDAVLAPVFGAYSKAKHAVCMDLMERPFPETKQEFDMERNQWRSLGWKCNEYFKENVVMDNEQDPPMRILPWL